ncbi:LytR/AlgR family response regulator transcription factor [Eilatimonas milleporae]|uniref:LytTR family two component transcriptional regulator n=1 Tax=Eilatimonas milleporae TaxID=911205 RepID=A0A3M0CEP4_9PROT|nr:response regulator [Eilatimonas milleporae]RMB07842.1 LytTR family two component transcriptional regulator [Eilatimonas milleporae]
MNNSRTIRTLLVDDEPLAIRGLKIRLEAFDDIEIVGSSANGRDAVKAIKDLRPDLVFLDIQMPGFDGFAVIRSLIGETDIPLVIFVTAYDQYALEAFEAHALDYLLKPVEPERLAEAVHRVRERLATRVAVEQNAKLVRMIEGMEGTEKDVLTAILDQKSAPADDTRFDPQLRIKDRGHITIVNVADIDYIDAAGDYMCIHVDDKTHILRETMKTMERRLDPRVFQRIHRSTIVNLDKVQEVRPHANGECFLRLSSGKELKVSRSHKDVVGRFL